MITDGKIGRLLHAQATAGEPETHREKHDEEGGRMAVHWIARDDERVLRIEGREVATYTRVTAKEYRERDRFDSARIIIEANSGKWNTIGELAAAVGEAVTVAFKNRVRWLAERDGFIDVRFIGS